MASTFSFRGLLARTNLPTAPSPLARLFSTSPQCLARKAPSAKGGKVVGKTGGAGQQNRGQTVPKRFRGPVRSENYNRIKILKQNMFSPAPPPLRMARLRHLRHWTIHRAWQLFRRQQHEAIEKERSRMHAGMYNACEELRTTVGPGARGEGYLYRVAMEKKNVYHVDSVPIEYARFQTDSPAKEAWNHEWTRA